MRLTRSTYTQPLLRSRRFRRGLTIGAVIATTIWAGTGAVVWLVLR